MNTHSLSRAADKVVCCGAQTSSRATLLVKANSALGVFLNRNRNGLWKVPCDKQESSEALPLLHQGSSPQGLTATGSWRLKLLVL